MIHQRLAAHGGVYVSLSGIPSVLQQAVVATEDAGFWTNPGIDPKGMARSLLVDIVTASFQQEGSTITQQLARDMLLNPNKTLWRKAKEMLLALVITHYYHKDAILEMYLNEVYLGHGAYGVERAARVCFGVAPESLTAAQSVMLAGLPRGPSLCDPLVHLRSRSGQIYETVRPQFARCRGLCDRPAGVGLPFGEPRRERRHDPPGGPARQAQDILAPGVRVSQNDAVPRQDELVIR